MRQPSYQGAFLACVEHLNAFLANRALRRYQLLVVEAGGFSVSSPFRAAQCPLTECLLLGSDLIAYLFGSEQFCLLVGPQHEGYPLTRMLCLDSGASWEIASIDSPGAASGEITQESMDLCRQVRAMATQSPIDTRPHALFGDGNFAHLVWNGLAALRALVDTGVDLTGTRLVSRCDPLGDPAQFLRRHSSMRTEPWSTRIDLHQGRRFRSATLLGSCYIDAALAASVVEVCHSRSHDHWRQTRLRLAASSRRKLWISLRQRQRDCSNQVAFVATLVDRILQSSDTIILIDGFSLPDCETPPFFATYAERVDQAFRELLVRCPRLVEALASGDAVFMNGLMLYDSISLASLADFYVCHGGTQQHKIGWLYSTPGVLHVPNPSAAVQQWYADQSEVATPPICLPASVITAKASEGVAPGESDYEIDVAAAVPFCLNAARPFLV